MKKNQLYKCLNVPNARYIYTSSPYLIFAMVLQVDMNLLIFKLNDRPASNLNMAIHSPSQEKGGHSDTFHKINFPTSALVGI